MNYSIYVIRDELTDKFVHLFVEDNDATAQRSFFAWCKQIPQPENYHLHFAGFWNNQSGEIDGEHLRFVCDGE